MDMFNGAFTITWLNKGILIGCGLIEAKSADGGVHPTYYQARC
jgi:hypothetical protein